MSNDNIRQYILENPKYLTGYYNELANKFNISYERARHIARGLRDKNTTVQQDSPNRDTHFRENVQTGDATISMVTPKRVKTKEDLIAVCNIDLTEYEISTWEVTTWEGYRADKISDLQWNDGIVNGKVKDTGKIITETLYRVNVKLKRRKLDTDLQLQKELILAEIKNGLTSQYDISKEIQYIGNKGEKYLLELALFDLHFGKMAWSEETGDDYDLKIAEQRCKESILKLLSRVNLALVDRILFPIGNDMINIDNKNNTTTAGTPQDSDTRFYKIIKVVRRVLVEVINGLAQIAPVDVVVVPGNHDETTSFFIGEILDAFYHSNPRVTVDCGPSMRKYYQYGTNGILLTHGNEEKHLDLVNIFATERPHLWAATYYRFGQIGHQHKNKKIEYLSVDEHQGFQLQVLPSLSGRDAWHARKGYGSKKQAKLFLFHETEGMIGEYTVTI